jgi:hypothetical protein
LTLSALHSFIECASLNRETCRPRQAVLALSRGRRLLRRHAAVRGRCLCSLNLGRAFHFREYFTKLARVLIRIRRGREVCQGLPWRVWYLSAAQQKDLTRVCGRITTNSRNGRRCHAEARTELSRNGLHDSVFGNLIRRFGLLPSFDEARKADPRY